MHRMLSIILVLAVLLGAACSPENQSISGTASISVTVEDNTAKTISPDGNVDITHYVITAINEAEGISEESEMLSRGESFTVTNVPAGIWKAEVDAYIQRGTEYVYVATAASEETRVPADSTVTIPVSLEELLDEASGDITLTIMMPAELDDEGDSFHYTYTIQGTGQRAEYIYETESPLAGFTGTGGAAGISIEADAIGLLQGSYLLTVTVFDGETEVASNVVRTAVDAIRLIAGTAASGTLDMRSQQLTEFRISITDSIGDIIEPLIVDGKNSYKIEATGTSTSFTLEFEEALDASWSIEWYLDGSSIEAVADGNSYEFSIPKGKHSVIGIVQDEAMAMSVGSVEFDIEAEAEIIFYEEVIIERYIDLAKNTDIPAGYVNTGYVKAGMETEGLTEGDIIFPYKAKVPSGISYDELTPEICGLEPVNVLLTDYLNWDSNKKQVTQGVPDKPQYLGKYIGFSDEDDIQILGSDAGDMRGEGMVSTHGSPLFSIPYSGMEPVPLRECYIPDSVKVIGDGAFREFEELQYITIPEGLEYIHWGAFKGDFTLEAFKLPAGLKGLGSQCFQDCSKFIELWIPDSCTDYGNEFCREFSEGPFLKSVRIPASWTSIPNVGDLGALEEYWIGEELFEGEFPSGITVIEDYAFGEAIGGAGEVSGWGSDMGLIIPEGCKTIGKYAFSNTLFKTISLPSTLSSLGASAFDSMDNLSGLVIIPELVTELPSRVFEHRYGNKDLMVQLHDSITSIGNHALEGCFIQGNHLPTSLQTIGNGNEFRGLNDSKVLKFPDSLTSIGTSGSSNNIQFEYVYIPEGVEYVGQEVFGETTYSSLYIKIYCEATEQPAEWDEEWYKTIFGSVGINWGISEEEFDSIVTEAGYGEYL